MFHIIPFSMTNGGNLKVSYTYVWYDVHQTKCTKRQVPFDGPKHMCVWLSFICLFIFWCLKIYDLMKWYTAYITCLL